MMRDERYAIWSWSMPPWILGNLSLSPSAVMCTRKKEIWQDLLCGWKDALYLSLPFPCSCVFSFFFYWEIKSMRWCSLRHAGLMMKERALLLLSCAGCVQTCECMSVCAQASNPATNTFFARTRALLIWALMLWREDKWGLRFCCAVAELFILVRLLSDINTAQCWSMCRHQHTPEMDHLQPLKTLPRRGWKLSAITPITLDIVHFGYLTHTAYA